MRKWKYWSAFQSALFGIGFLCLIIAIALQNPQKTLICFAVGIVGVLPFAIDWIVELRERKPNKNESVLGKQIRWLGYATGFCGIMFYLMLIGMKILHGYGISIPDWIGLIWFGLMILALVSFCLREHLIKQQKKMVSLSPAPAVAQKKNEEETVPDNMLEAVSVQKVKVEAEPVPTPRESKPKQPPKQKKQEKVKFEPTETKQAKPRILNKSANELVLDGRQQPSHGEVELYDLTLLVREEGPSLRWSVSWRGGYSHADGAGDVIPIPADILAKADPKALIKWMKTVLYPNPYDLISWQKVENNTQIGSWLQSVQLKNEDRAAAVQKKLQKMLPSGWSWDEFDVLIRWTKGAGYQLLVLPDRQNPTVVRSVKEENRFMEQVLLFLALQKPKGLLRISRHFTPLAKNHWAGRGEHGDEGLYLEAWNQGEYLLWYTSQEFDTQSSIKMVGETCEYRIISESNRKEHTLQEYLEESGLEMRWNSWAVKTLKTNPRFAGLFRV